MHYFLEFEAFAPGLFYYDLGIIFHTPAVRCLYHFEFDYFFLIWAGLLWHFSIVNLIKKISQFVGFFFFSDAAAYTIVILAYVFFCSYNGTFDGPGPF